MTKLILETDNSWTKTKVKEAIFTEIAILKNAISRTTKKIEAFRQKHNAPDTSSLFGKVDDMELIEWEGEEEILKELKTNLEALEEIEFEY